MKKNILVFSFFLMVGFAVKAQDPVITFTAKVHDFGQIKQGTPVTYDFVFKNTGKAPLFLSQPRSSCGCTVPSYPKEPIMPGQNGKISITFDAEKAGEFSKQVTIISNAENSPETIVIKGVVIP